MYWFSEVLENQNVHCGGSGFYNRDYLSSEMVQKVMGPVSNGPPWLQCPVRKTFFFFVRTERSPNAHSQEDFAWGRLILLPLLC